MKTKNMILLALACVSVPMAVQAKVISGSSNGMSWTAQSRIVGVTSTATITTPPTGDPIYVATAAKYKGTVGLLMTYANGDAFVCSGSLMADRRSILTAGHCVSDGAGTANPVSTKAFFYGGTDPNVSVYAAGAPVTTIDVTNYFVNSNYTGEVIDQNDIAVLRLADFAPSFATAYDLFEGDDLTGTDFNTAGYGARSNGGGNVGANLGTGRLRQGDNRYEFRLGDGDFDGFFSDINPDTGTNFFRTTADIRFSYVSDFDNGLAANDASCLIAGAFSLGGAKYCNLGRGATEVSVAGGDSGGPQFVNGKVASVTSYGLSFGPNFGDILPSAPGAGPNSSFGEFNGFVPIGIHRSFIMTSMVPEPATWAMMIGGFGMIGASMRFRRRSDVSARATA